MHRNLHSPTKLTEFARDFDTAEPDTLFGKFVNRLTSAYNTSYNAVNVAPYTSTSQFVLHAPHHLSNAPVQTPTINNQTVVPAAATATTNSSYNRNNNQRSTPIDESASSSSSSSNSNISLSLQPTAVPSVEPESEAASLASARSASNNNKSSTPSSGSRDDLSTDKSGDNNPPPAADRLQSSVISRIGSLIAMKRDTLTSYKDTELQRFWMPDAKSKECYECQLKFTTFRRKHHCRLCGQIFCSKCCNQVVPGKIINCSDDLKVCTYCSKFVLSYLKSADINADLGSDLQALQLDLTTKLSGTQSAHHFGNQAAASPCGSSGGRMLGRIGSGAGLHRDGHGSGSSALSLRHQHGTATAAASSAADATAGDTAAAYTSRLARRKISAGYQEERLVSVQPHQFGGAAVSSAERKRMLQQSASLKALHEQLVKAMPYATATGFEFVHYVVVSTQMAASELQAVDILNAMLQAGFLVPHQMHDLATAMPTMQMTTTAAAAAFSATAAAFSGATTSSEDDDELMLLLEFSEQRTYTLLGIDEVLKMNAIGEDVEGAVHLRRSSTAGTAAHCEQQQDSIGVAGGGGVHVELSAYDISLGFSSSKDVEMQNSVLSTAGSKPLMEAFCDHEELLLTQLLLTESIADAWSKPLLQLCAEIVNAFNPGQCGMTVLEQPRRSMDIRHFVNVKKVPGGQRHESRICGGIGFTKNVVHKDMAALIEKPRVLLLRCAIAYQRDEGRFVSIETLRLQETEHLRNVTARILQLRPQVVLVHRNVAGIAQDMLRASGVTLVLDVKIAVLERLARTLQCDIVESIDSNVGRPKLGTCDRFRTETFVNEATGASKTLMFFEQQSLQRGCCVLLRGSEAELVRVKRVARMLLYARYNWRLEMALLLDEFARPPSPRAGIFDSKDQSPVKETEAVDESEERGEINDETAEAPRPKSPQQRAAVVVRNLENRCSTDTPPTSAVVVLTTKQNVQDFSDPLRSAVDLSPGTMFDPDASAVEFAVETPCDNRFRTALSSTVLSVSPFVTFPLPYLETESGRKCALRRRFPQQLYYSKQWSSGSESRPAFNADANNPDRHARASAPEPSQTHGELQPHEFLTMKMTSSVYSRDLQAKWASFRACGGRMPATVRRTTDETESDKKPAAVALQHTAQQQPSRIDALAIENHQRLPVLFLSFYYSGSKPASAYCTPPSLLRMTFYGEQDIMLGQFLEHYCFRRSYMCKSCSLPMLSHVRRFVHSLGCVQVKLSEDHSNATATAANEHILMTSWCGMCHAMTPSVPISRDTWCLSFAKYLEQRFHGHVYRRARSTAAGDTSAAPADDSTTGDSGCVHSMHRDHVHYFSLNGIVASFAYTPIQCWSLSLPATVRTLQPAAATASGGQHLEEIKQFSQTGYEVFARIYDRLATVSGDGELPLLPGLKQTLNRDQLDFRDRIALVQTLLTESATGATGSKNGVWDVQDAMWGVKRLLAQNIEHWTLRLTEATQAAAAVVSTTSGGSQSQQRASRSDSASTVIDAGQICTEDLWNEAAQSAQSPILTAAATAIPDAGSEALNNESAFSPSPTKTPAATAAPNPTAADQTTPAPPTASSASAATSDKKSVKTILRELLPSDKPAVCCIPSPLPNAEHYLLSTGGKFPVTVHDQDLSSVIAFTLVSHDYKRTLDARQQQQLNAVAAAAAAATSSATAAQQAATAAAASAGASSSSSSSVVGPAADGAAAAASNYTATASTSSASSSVTLDSDGVAEHREPGEKKKSLSASAHVEVQFTDSTTTFTCKTYFAREFDTLRASLVSTTGNVHASSSSSGSPPNREANKDGPNESQHTTPLHGGRNVPQTSAAATSATSAADYADEARALFARSLCRSAQWEARGGKSGSKFCKTMDDRFVLKEMSRVDVNIFENFAPKYFEYIAQCLQRDEPTLLAKIFGVYRVTIRKKDSVTEKSLLVMENLFYNSAITNKYDLKGSDRNRLVTPSVFGGEHVLLDENLIQESWSQPLYILGHSQSVLLGALMRDASFLERNEVMDYSLLVGLNGDDKILVLGIIDYIRTFTFDKRIESYFKKSGILGGQGKLPTVISPKLYKQRFLEAMERYFLVVPDRWEGLEQHSNPKS